MTEPAADRRSDLWRSLQALSQEEGVWRPNLAQLLDGELSILRDVWRINTQADISDIRKAVSANLYALVVAITPRPARQDLSVEQRKRQYVHTVMSSFNVHTPAELRNSKLQERRNWLAAEGRGPLRVAVTIGQRDLAHAIDHIEQVLSSHGYEPNKPVNYEENLGDRNEEPQLEGKLQISDASVRVVSRKFALVAVLAVVALSIAGTVLIPPLFHRTSGSPPPSSSSVNPNPMPAPADSPPIQVENITGIQARHGDLRFVLPDPLNMTTSELAEFNNNTFIKSRDFAPWYVDHGGVPVDFGTTNITLRGNRDEAVRITEMKAIKDCKDPLNGTFFAGYTQGGPTESTKLGIDLDAAVPTVQELVSTTDGLRTAGGNYFSEKTIELAPGEVQTLSVSAFTTKYGCSFTLQLTVATAEGAFFQDIDFNGKPFIVTAMAPAVQDEYPLSGYEAAYLQQSSLEWAQVDPRSHGFY